MELTREQRAAAEACGCALIPATEEQVRRLSMQRRVFRLDGEPVLATRGGGYFETHGTLAAMMETHAAVLAKRRAATEGPRSHDRPAASGAEPAAGGPEPAHAVGPGADPPTPAAGPSPLPVPCSLEPDAHAAEPEGLPRDDAATSATDAGGKDLKPAEGMDAADGGVSTRPRTARTPRKRRAGEPETPGWATAGKAWRGRLK